MTPELRRLLRLGLRARHDPAAGAALRAEIARRPPEWAQFSAAAEQARIAPLLHRALREVVELPPEVQHRLRRAYLANAHRNLIILRALEAVLADLDRAGVPVIVLKGTALAATVYRNFAVRPLMDVDVLMRREHLDAALAVAARHGFHPERPETRAGSTAAYENELALIRREPMPIALEIHWSLFDSPFYQERLDLDFCWRNTQPLDLGGTTTRMLAPMAQLLHLCGHLVLHHGGEDLLWEEDIAELVRLEGASIDWNDLCDHARELDLVIPVRDLLLALAADGATGIPPAALERLRALRPSADEARVVGYLTAEQRSVAQRFWSDLASMGGWRARLGYAWTHLFPSAEYMRARYGIRYSLLLPLYYPYRWLRGILGWS